MMAGFSLLAAEQPAMAYDSVVSMLQSWLIGGSLMLIFAAVLVAATANPLTKRR